MFVILLDIIIFIGILTFSLKIIVPWYKKKFMLFETSKSEEIKIKTQKAQEQLRNMETVKSYSTELIKTKEKLAEISETVRDQNECLDGLDIILNSEDKNE